MKVCIISGSRADWSGLEMVGMALKASPKISEVSVFMMWDDLNTFDRDTDNPAEKASETMAAFAFARRAILINSPDLLVINGDRTEMLAVATAAYVMQVPIVHLSGGDRTLGSADDAMRDAISMLASLHFPTSQTALYRLINELGINGARVHCVGSPAVDRLLALPKVSREAIFSQYKINPVYPLVILSLHPNTITGDIAEVTETLMALDQYDTRFSGRLSVLAVSPNTDLGFLPIRDAIQLFCASQPSRRKYVANLPPEQYLCFLREARAIIGNSSSGIYEAPYLGTPAINVGDRQKGRPAAAMVWNVGVNRQAIFDALMCTASVPESMGKAHRSFGDGNAAQRIAEIVSAIDNPKGLLRRIR